PVDEDAGRAPRPRRRGVRNRPQGQGDAVASTSAPAVPDGDASADEALSEGLVEIPFEEMDQERLSALSLEAVEHLVTPIVGRIPLKVELQEGRVNVVMDCGEDSGLLIGREGQTLASLQYLASRIVSRGMGAAVRVQLDAGEYRLRQDEKLREMALALAEKVRATGKSHSTRPLSSYHRRIIHMTLQDAPDVQTRSSGDGPLKRVVIQRKKG
ncbi:MAG: KH domain-containing protein, partial [Desulfovibrionaceae bacterium]|nr:KH domain-containing protein [Desulfovibrionaceae bacterium]